jgi:GntR family transcriptional regulator/MocR family aminotransferase
VAAGLNVLVTLPAGVAEAAVVTAALAAGVRVHPLGGFRAGTGSDDVPGLVLGYGTLFPEAAELGVRRLAAAIRG